MSWIEYDTALIEDIAARLTLRDPNKRALTRIIEEIHKDGWHEVVCDLATGVGKTYITAALVDYLAAQGVRNILIVTPGKTIQDKTVANFTPGHAKFVSGAEYPPILITAENFARGQVGDALHDRGALKLFVFNVQQLIRPTANVSRRVRELDEFIGTDLYNHLQAADDLVVIADEHHVYRAQATVFSNAVRQLKPRALVGLTATPDKADLNKIIFRYSLAEAIADHLVKIPVIVYREDGHKDIGTQLADACHLLRVKAAAMFTWSNGVGEPQVNPVLFVVCQTVDDAKEVSNLLASDGYIGNAGAVLEITSQSSDDALSALQRVEEPNSPIRAVVSVDKLKEGWDVKNIGVIVALRKLASQSLTEQILGRGLRLPYGRRVGVPMIDTVDLVAHDSYRRLLADKEVLLERIMPTASNVASRQTSANSPQSTNGASENFEQGVLRLVTPPRIVNGEDVDGSAGLILASLDAVVEQGKRDLEECTKILKPVSGASVIEFPRREREVLPIKFTLSFVSDIDARAAGAAFATEVKVPLIRRAITARRGLGGEVTIHQEAQREETATQQYVPVENVRRDLEDRIISLNLVESSLAEYNGAQRVIKAFLEGARVQEGDDVSWGEARAKHATDGLAELIKDRYNTRRLQPIYVFRKVLVPVYPKPMPCDVIGRFEGTKFERGRWYSGWNRSILPVASFDAATTEFALANLLDDSPRIKWWLRLQTREPAYVELDNGRKYYPDFIAIDNEDTHWVIEGKSDDAANYPDSQAKRIAAEEWIRFVNDDGRFGKWRYLFATERAIKRANNNWEGLLAQVKPE